MPSRNTSLGLPWFDYCIFVRTGPYMPCFTVVWSLLVFPLYSLVLHTGFQRWRKNKRSPMSHADFFTYNSFAFELVALSGYVIYSVATLRFKYKLMTSAVVVLYFTYPGVLSLHVLTCVERYLAVVHPVVYLGLKQQKWIWARNVVIAVIWALSLAWAVVFHLVDNANLALLAMLGTVAATIAICSVRVLRALRNPSPGEGHGVSKSKRKAFNTMLAILVVLLFWLTGAITSTVLDEADLLEWDAICKLQLSESLFELPSSLVLPLLFLHRAGKLPKCQSKMRKKRG